ncbi:MAG: hypothetical protein AB8H80_09725, partial [Planctomycetota bacterium]
MLLLAGIATPITMALVGVPYVGLPLAAMIGAAITAVVWMQPPMAVRGLPLAARLRLLQKNPWRALGTGFGLQIAVGVPFANVLAWTLIATIASSSAYVHFDKRGGEGAASGDSADGPANEPADEPAREHHVADPTER